jgi:hypothetical protein
MPITYKKRADVTPAFIELMVQTYTAWLVMEENRINSNYSPTSLITKRAPVVNRIKLITSGTETVDRSGLSYEITRLRTLDDLYSKFDAYNYDGKDWFSARSQPVIIDASGRKYHMGVYKVYVPCQEFINGHVGQEHFVPLKNPLSDLRHPHHKASGRDSSALSKHPATCWGSFGNIISGIMGDCDLPEYFRQVGLYLGRYNPQSPYISRGIDGVDFDTTKTWEERAVTA